MNALLAIALALAPVGTPAGTGSTVSLGGTASRHSGFA
jgi:hypothetical protein